LTENWIGVLNIALTGLLFVLMAVLIRRGIHLQ